MHSEHLQNVRVIRVVTGWLVAIAVTSLIMLVLTSLGVSDASAWWSLFAVASGFFVGGMFCGMRALQAPVLHGIAMGLTSLVAWVVLNVVVYGIQASPATHSFIVIEGALTPLATAVLVLVHIVAAILGALVGYNIALRGKPGLSEHEPIA
jgi:hypothetical protein